LPGGLTGKSTPDASAPFTLAVWIGPVTSGLERRLRSAAS
jgi:hypothetical protein